MSKKILFIRHGQLLAPYDDYNRLSFDQLRQLSLRTIDPGIDESQALIRVKLLLEKFDLSEYQTIMVSESARTKATAAVIIGHLSGPVPVQETFCLNEILFELNQLITEQDLHRRGLEAVREGLFRALVEKRNTDSLVSIFDRLGQLEKMILESSAQNIICVTHGFFMRFVQLYFGQSIRSPEGITVPDIMSVKNPDYLEGIQYTDW
jgi:broad specificity phosphatase PhoE